MDEIFRLNSAVPGITSGEILFCALDSPFPIFSAICSR
uniref:Bm14304, isoform b n=1 Tax=Brugia malayi TaxID=6279 RepID=A0A1I9G542_BRUMA|nr:Bm14304, isoform b [Brugia malayi]